MTVMRITVASSRERPEQRGALFASCLMRCRKSRRRIASSCARKATMPGSVA